MRTTASISTVAALGLLALSSPAAEAAPATIGKVSQNGSSLSVKLANPNRYRVSGSVALISGQQLVAKRRTAIKPRRSTTVVLRVPSGAPTTVSVVSKLARKGHRASTSRRSLKLAAPGKRSATAPAPVQAPPPKPASNLWTATAAGGGTFGLVVQNGLVSLAEPIDMGVICNQTGEYVYNAQSQERFNEGSNWTLGNQSDTRFLDTWRVNPLMDGGDHRVTFRLTTSQAGSTITGSLHQSFFTSKYNPFTYGMSYVNCAGTAGFTAHPAG